MYNLKLKIIIILLLFIILIISGITKEIQYETIEIGRVIQILHPEYPKGRLQYDPHWNYSYFVAYVAKLFDYNENLKELATIFWFIEGIITILVLIKLSDLLFDNDKITAMIVCILYILLKNGQVDQKTMLMPIYLLAVYYFLTERWKISAILGGTLFYLHVGFAVWWILPSYFALVIILVIKKKEIFYDLVKYSIIVIILSFPIVYFYFNKVQGSTVDIFSIKYYYYSGYKFSSLLLSITSDPIVTANRILMLSIVLLGYYKLKDDKISYEKIILLFYGTLTVYLIDYIFADLIGNIQVITLQMLRSIITINILAQLFIASFLAKHIRNGNYYYFIVYCVILIYNGYITKYLGVRGYEVVTIGFYILIICYEICEKKELYSNIKNKIISKIRQLNATLYIILKKLIKLPSHPVYIASLVILLILPRIQYIKPFIKDTLNIKYDFTKADIKNNYYFKDITEFTNEQIQDKNCLLVINPLDIDFVYYTKQKCFITAFTPIDNVYIGHKTSEEFKNILNNDFKCTIQELFFENGKFNSGKRNKLFNDIWKMINEKIIIKWKDKYNITHVIRENYLPLNFPIVYKNAYYTVYKI